MSSVSGLACPWIFISCFLLLSATAISSKHGGSSGGSLGTWTSGWAKKFLMSRKILNYVCIYSIKDLNFYMFLSVVIEKWIAGSKSSLIW